jgi:heat shock protein beta
MMKVISRKSVKKAIEMIKNLAVSKDDDEEETKDEEKTEEQSNAKQQKGEEKYLKFWTEFGKNIKLGIIEDPGNRRRLAQLTRWGTSRNSTELTSLDDYISRAKTGQDFIYFLAGDNKETLMKSPILQGLLKRGYEVLLLDDPIDEFCFQHLNEYGKKKLQNVAKGEFRFPDDDDSGRKRIKKLKKMFKPLTEWWSKSIKEHLENVLISQRLVDDPCVIISSEHGHSANMEKISKAQAYSSTNRQQQFVGTKKILEINPSHPLIKELLERVKDNADQETEDMARMLTETALINSGLYYYYYYYFYYYYYYYYIQKSKFIRIFS